eukprot:175426-Pleurochrysis_carterae.AAC.3
MGGEVVLWLRMRACACAAWVSPQAGCGAPGQSQAPCSRACCPCPRQRGRLIGEGWGRGRE